MNEPLVFGPVPSRRLGRSLGINNVPLKHCSYSCVYCQVGATRTTQTAPRAFHRPAEIVAAVSKRVRFLRRRGEGVDYLTFVPDGEPTLDEGLGEAIDGLRPLGIPVAVVSNGSLAWRADVRSRLARADWVSLKVDAADEATWRRINRPDPGLGMRTVLEGMLRFRRSFGGRLCSETMLLRDVNDTPAATGAALAFLERFGPRIAYLAVPTRPTAEPGARAATEQRVTAVFRRFRERLPRVELLTGFEGTDFGPSGDPAEDLLAITAVHPDARGRRAGLPRALGGRGRHARPLAGRGPAAAREHRGPLVLRPGVPAAREGRRRRGRNGRALNAPCPGRSGRGEPRGRCLVEVAADLGQLAGQQRQDVVADPRSRCGPPAIEGRRLGAADAPQCAAPGGPKP
jgi:wyosine [tRNA(Phe)-imidazoG37] synthetase (radical SAM superfamily)